MAKGDLHNAIRKFWESSIDEGNQLNVPTRELYIARDAFFGEIGLGFTPLHFAINFAINMRNRAYAVSDSLGQAFDSRMLAVHLPPMVRTLLMPALGDANHEAALIPMLIAPEPIGQNYPLSMFLQASVLSAASLASIHVMNVIRACLPRIASETLCQMLLQPNKQGFTPYMLAGKAQDPAVFAALDELIVHAILTDAVTRQAQITALQYVNEAGYNCLHGILQEGCVDNLRRFLATVILLNGRQGPDVFNHTAIRKLLLQETSTGFNTLLSGLKHPDKQMVETFLTQVATWHRMNILDDASYRALLICQQENTTELYVGLVHAGQAEESENFWHYTQALKAAFNHGVLSRDDILLMLDASTCGQHIVAGFNNKNMRKNTRNLVSFVLDVFHKTETGEPASALQAQAFELLANFKVNLHSQTAALYLQAVTQIFSKRGITLAAEQQALQPDGDPGSWRSLTPSPAFR